MFTRIVTRWVIIGILLTLALFALHWLAQRLVTLTLVVMVLLLAGCNYQVPTPPVWKCHRAIRYAIYQSGACVIYDI